MGSLRHDYSYSEPDEIKILTATATYIVELFYYEPSSLGKLLQLHLDYNHSEVLYILENFPIDDIVFVLAAFIMTGQIERLGL